jgi:hypothetical protein
MLKILFWYKKHFEIDKFVYSKQDQVNGLCYDVKIFLKNTISKCLLSTTQVNNDDVCQKPSAPNQVIS